MATHEHKDHLSGFNQAREVFNDDFEFGAVWLGWTENLSKPEIKKIKEARKKAVAKLRPARQPSGGGRGGHVGRRRRAPRLQRGRGRDRHRARSPRRSTTSSSAARKRATCSTRAGRGPFELDGVEGVRVYVLGPPRDPILLKGSEVTEQMKNEGVVYHLPARARPAWTR